MRIHCGRCGQMFDDADAFAAHNPHEAETPTDLKIRLVEGQRGGPPNTKGPRIHHLSTLLTSTPSTSPTTTPTRKTAA